MRGAGSQSPLRKPRKHADGKAKDGGNPTFGLNNKEVAGDRDEKFHNGVYGIQPTLDLQFENTLLHNKHP